MDPDFSSSAEQISAFQKIWIESATKLFQAAFSSGAESAPPEFLRQVRSGMFQALAQSWDEFMRSPQFLDATRQWMENAITFRKLSNDFMARVRTELQAPSRGDVDSIMLTVRHMEKRLLDRLDELSAEVKGLKGQAASPSAKSGPGAPRSRRKTASRVPSNGRAAAV